jgi:hypothetical protein
MTTTVRIDADLWSQFKHFTACQRGPGGVKFMLETAVRNYMEQNTDEHDRIPDEVFREVFWPTAD